MVLDCKMAGNWES